MTITQQMLGGRHWRVRLGIGTLDAGLYRSAEDAAAALSNFNAKLPSARSRQTGRCRPG